MSDKPVGINANVTTALHDFLKINSKLSENLLWQYC